MLLSTLLFTVEVPFYEYEEGLAYDFDSAGMSDYSFYANSANVDRELSAQYHPGVGGMDDDIHVNKEKDNDKNVNNNDDRKRLRSSGRVRSVFPDSWIWTETNIRYLIDTVKNVFVGLHFDFYIVCSFLLICCAYLA